jgi:peptidoglycan DL-endopeptidase LytE
LLDRFFMVLVEMSPYREQMKKAPKIFSLLILILLFAAGQAYSAASQKPGSRNAGHKASKKHRARVTNKVKIEPVTVEREAASTGSRYGKKRSLKSRKTQASTVAKAAFEAQEVATAEKDDGEYVEYRLRRGETLEKLAARFNVDKDEIIELNGVKRSPLKRGAVVLIPKVEEDAEETPLMFNDRPLKPWKNEEERGILVKVAKSFAGAPYRYGGDTVRGLDCSAFVKKMYEIFEVQLPRSAREQYCAGPRVDRDDLVTGDLVFFRTKRFAKYPTHVGIYIGDDKFIHSSSLLSKGVKVDCLSDHYFARTYTGAVRVKAPPAVDRSDTNRVINESPGNS